MLILGCFVNKHIGDVEEANGTKEVKTGMHYLSRVCCASDSGVDFFWGGGGSGIMKHP